MDRLSAVFAGRKEGGGLCGVEIAFGGMGRGGVSGGGGYFDALFTVCFLFTEQASQ